MSDNVMFAAVPYVVMVAFLVTSAFRCAATMRAPASARGQGPLLEEKLHVGHCQFIKKVPRGKPMP